MANTSIGRVRVGQQRPTLITNPNLEVKTNVAMSDIVDVSTANVQNGYALTFNSTTQTYEFTDVGTPLHIRGGTF